MKYLDNYSLDNQSIQSSNSELSTIQSSPKRPLIILPAIESSTFYLPSTVSPFINIQLQNTAYILLPLNNNNPNIKPLLSCVKTHVSKQPKKQKLPQLNGLENYLKKSEQNAKKMKKNQKDQPPKPKTKYNINNEYYDNEVKIIMDECVNNNDIKDNDNYIDVKEEDNLVKLSDVKNIFGMLKLALNGKSNKPSQKKAYIPLKVRRDKVFDRIKLLPDEQKLFIAKTYVESKKIGCELVFTKSDINKKNVGIIEKKVKEFELINKENNLEVIKEQVNNKNVEDIMKDSDLSESLGNEDSESSNDD